MKTKFLLIGSFLVIVLLATACGSQPTAMATVPPAPTDTPTAVVPTDTATPEGPPPVEDFNGLLEALRTAGGTVAEGEEVEQVFFTVKGRILTVNNSDVQVFVYDTAEAMEAEAAQVAADGGSIGTNMVSWVDAPHFYKLGRMIVLYVGQDQAVLDLLNGVLGPQFAGR